MYSSYEVTGIADDQHDHGVMAMWGALLLILYIYIIAVFVPESISGLGFAEKRDDTDSLKSIRQWG